MTWQNSVTTRPLKAADAREVAAFLKAQPPAYARFFYALEANETRLAALFDGARRDFYAGVFCGGEMVGIFMLRGWDSGYEIPSFGVIIDEKHKGGAFFQLTLDQAKLVSRQAGAKKILAKCHPDNLTARGARRFGFYQVGVEEATGNIVYHLEL